MNSSTIDLVFRYSERDFIRAMRAHYSSRLRLTLDIIVIVSLASWGVYDLQSPHPDWFGKFSLVVSAVFALMLIAVFFVIPPLMFRRESKFRDEYSLTFNPDGIHFRTVHLDSNLQWEMYSRALVDHQSFLLYYGAAAFTIVPKRVFKSPEQMRAFEELLANKMPKIVRRDT